MNLFFSIVSRMRDQGNKTVRFSFDQLKELSNYKPTANKRFIDDIENTYQKILRTCLDTLTFDLILVKLNQKQGFLIHEKLCTPL